jgi:transposase-like protein
MDFREAARRLGEQITTATMAKELGVSEHTVRQARLQAGASGHRSPPEGWPRILARLAREREGHFRSLADALEKANQ